MEFRLNGHKECRINRNKNIEKIQTKKEKMKKKKRKYKTKEVKQRNRKRYNLKNYINLIEKWQIMVTYWSKYRSTKRENVQRKVEAILCISSPLKNN